jgi:hypothetical protein
MLNYTFIRVLTSPPSRPEEQLDFNAYLESFGVHARNLVAFLSEKSPYCHTVIEWRHQEWRHRLLQNSPMQSRNGMLIL